MANRKTEAQVILGERLRISDIMESPEGKARPNTALKFALHSALSAEQARHMLASLPTESPFLGAMDREGQIGVASAFAETGSIASTDKKASRLEEIKRSATSFSVGKGFLSHEQAAARGVKLKA